MSRADEIRRRVAALSDDQVEQLAARLKREAEARRTMWLCGSSVCSGAPHDGVPVRHARANQRLPFKQGDGKAGCLWMAGRGFGKTRIGAEGTRFMVQSGRAGRIGLIGRTAADVRDVMLEGESGLLNVFPKWDKPRYIPSKRKVEFSNGAQAFLYSSVEPDLLRGPQHDFIWGDEFSTWLKLKGVMANALMGLRLGDEPRMILTGTPRPTKDVKELVNNPKFIIIRGSTYDNLGNLAQTFRDMVVSQYEGTRLGRQELSGELLLDIDGALLSYDVIDRPGFRIEDSSTCVMGTVTVNVDPAVTNETSSDHTGITVTGVSPDRKTGYVLYSERYKGSPADAMGRVATLYDMFAANYVVGEVNNGGDYIATVLRQTRSDIPFKRVRASKGKYARAEPVGLLYEQGRIHHVGPPEMHAGLETEWCTWLPPGTKDDMGNDISSDESPDIMDSVVWGFTQLMLPKSATMGPARSART